MRSDVRRSRRRLGRVSDDEPYQEQTSPTFRPWRRRLDFLNGQEAPIRPLITELSFLLDKQRWGMPFWRGLFAIPASDFVLIARAMKAKI